MVKKSILFVLFLFIFSNFGRAQVQFNKYQYYISPFVSVGAPAILNQNNLGFGEMDYKLKPGGKIGILIGKENFFKTSFRFGLIFAKVGQVYRDVLLRLPHEKNISLTYIQIPFTYKYILEETKYHNIRDVFTYISAGFQLGYLIDAKVDWIRDGKKVDFYDFVSYGPYAEVNKNLEQIRDNGSIKNDKDFFSKIDVDFVSSLGVQYFVSGKTMIFGELIGNIGLRDINSPRWRFRNNKQAYNASINLYAGLRFGVNYYP